MGNEAPAFYNYLIYFQIQLYSNCRVKIWKLGRFHLILNFKFFLIFLLFEDPKKNWKFQYKMEAFRFPNFYTQLHFSLFKISLISKFLFFKVNEWVPSYPN